MEIKVLGVAEASEWHEYLKKLRTADIYFTPEYCRIYEENGEGIAQLFIYKDGNQFIYYPYILREIHYSHGPTANKDANLYDITTPYGYGGPLTNAEGREARIKIFSDFEDVFHQYCVDQHIISEFVRFHPLLCNYEDYSAVEPTFIRNTIYIDLRLSADELWSNYSKNNRNRIRRSQKEDLTVTVGKYEDMEAFIRLYYSTMEKKQADDYYYFSKKFMWNTVDFLQGNIDLMEVSYGNQVIASCLFMHYDNYVHYHLMGSDQQYLSYCPVNLLIHRAALWAKEKGYQFLHLGGGYEDNDNLLRFKRGFNVLDTANFYIGRKIHCLESYHWILQQMQLNLDHGNTYFPAYRQQRHEDVGIAISLNDTGDYRTRGVIQ